MKNYDDSRITFLGQQQQQQQWSNHAGHGRDCTVLQVVDSGNRGVQHYITVPYTVFSVWPEHTWSCGWLITVLNNDYYD